jgi:hypothetical protein
LHRPNTGQPLQAIKKKILNAPNVIHTIQNS